MAGGQHHHRTNLDKYHPGYFGKVGMRYFHKQQNHFWRPVINVERLWTLIPEDKRDQYLKEASPSAAPVIDTLAAGYGKVLGKGDLPRFPSSSRLDSSLLMPRRRSEKLVVSLSLLLKLYEDEIYTKTI